MTWSAGPFLNTLSHFTLPLSQQLKEIAEIAKNISRKKDMDIISLKARYL